MTTGAAPGPLRDGRARGRPARVGAVLAAALGSLALSAPVARSQSVVPTGFSDQQMMSGLDYPVGMAFLPDGRLLVIEQKTATVQLVIFGAITVASPILTVPEVNTSGAEQGLLGIAVDPGWPTYNYIYLHYDHAGDSKLRISRFLVTGDLNFTGGGNLAISPTSRYDVLADIPDLAPNHNGGTLRFGPDGMLYA
ncbi:MAG: PQQ-dependent sugar dehydrogenase, partial [Candidatus Eisenbacteria bacterium]